MADILQRCSPSVRVPLQANPEILQPQVQEALAAAYRLIEDPAVQQLALDPLSLSLAREKWVMYPDHAVFLGAVSPVLQENENLAGFFLRMAPKPVCIIMPHHGVLIRSDCTPAQQAMLVCYAAVVARIHDRSSVLSLSAEQIAALLNWDAEKYRQSLSQIIAS